MDATRMPIAGRIRSAGSSAASPFRAASGMPAEG